MNHPRLLATAALLLLGACKVGADYSPPDLEVLPDLYASDTQGDTAVSKVPLTDWWARLEDAELFALVDRALQANRDLAIARERVIENRARRGVEKAGWIPTLDATASYLRAETGDEGFILAGAPAGVGVDIYGAGVIAGWEADLWGRVSRLVEAADAEIGVAVADLRGARVSVVADTAREVFLIRTLDAEVEVVEASLAASQDTLDIAKARVAAGFSDSLDELRAQRVLARDRALLPELAQSRVAARGRLAVLLGAQVDAAQVRERLTPDLATLPARGLPLDLLRNRPDLQRLERELAAATARVGAAEAEFYPRLELTGSFTLQGPDAGDVVNGQAYVLGIGPAVTLPLLDRTRIRANVNGLESRQRQALLGLEGGVLRALAEVETAIQRLARVRERLMRLQEAETAAEDTLALARDRYRAGAVDFLSVTEAQVELLATKRDRIQAERAGIDRLLELYVALGGGWRGTARPANATARPDEALNQRAE